MDKSDRMAYKVKSEKKMDDAGESGKAKASDARFGYTRRKAEAPSATIGDFRGGRVYISLYDIDSRA